MDMSRFLRYALSPYAIFASICVASDYRKSLISDINMNVATLFPCLNYTAERLFSEGNRIGLICYECGNLENEIIKMFMKSRPIVVSNRPMYIKNRRPVSYVVFATKMFTESRRGLLKKGTNLHTLQYLFVSAAREETVLAFADELWRANFRDIAFLTLRSSGLATIQVPVMNRAVALRSRGYCSSSGNDLDQIVPYSSNFYRFCKQRPCTLLYGTVSDDTVQFWREEDRLKMSETDDYEAMGSMLIKRFTSFYDIEPYHRDFNLTWPEAAEKLINGELDIVAALMPENMEVMEGLEVICWYRNRILTFAALVSRRSRDHPVLQLLTPFHYSVWVCTIVTLLLYIFLLYALRKLAGKGLIKERLKFVQVYEIMLEQGVTFPKKMSLRAVLALWTIFSLNLSIIYNSTFTSSLADLSTEDLLKDLTELRDSGMSICGPSIVQYLLNDSNDQVIIDLRNRYRIMRRAEEMFDAIMSNNTMGVVQHTTVDRLNWATRTDRNLRIYTLTKPVLKFPVLFYTRAGHPYRVPFERVVMEYRESGLLYKWVKYYVIEEDKQIAAFQEYDEDDDDGGILTMEHLGPVFKFFFICQAVGVLIFFVELFNSRILGSRAASLSAAPENSLARVIKCEPLASRLEVSSFKARSNEVKHTDFHA